jgi:hypothetical protein
MQFSVCLPELAPLPITGFKWSGLQAVPHFTFPCSIDQRGFSKKKKPLDGNGFRVGGL